MAAAIAVAMAGISSDDPLGYEPAPGEGKKQREGRRFYPVDRGPRPGTKGKSSSLARLLKKAKRR